MSNDAVFTYVWWLCRELILNTHARKIFNCSHSLANNVLGFLQLQDSSDKVTPIYSFNLVIGESSKRNVAGQITPHSIQNKSTTKGREHKEKSWRQIAKEKEKSWRWDSSYVIVRKCDTRKESYFCPFPQLKGSLYWPHTDPLEFLAMYHQSSNWLQRSLARLSDFCRQEREP